MIHPVLISLLILIGCASCSPNPCASVSCGSSFVCVVTGLGTHQCVPTPVCSSDSDCNTYGQCTAGRCVCPSTLQGNRCEYRDRCLSGSLCNNGGTCVAAGYDSGSLAWEFTCACPAGYYGPTCSNVSPSTAMVMDMIDRYWYEGPEVDRSVDICVQIFSPYFLEAYFACNPYEGAEDVFEISWDSTIAIAPYAGPCSLPFAQVPGLGIINLVGSMGISSFDAFCFQDPAPLTPSPPNLQSINVGAGVILSGTFPSSLGAYVNLGQIDIQGLFGGTIPSDVGNLTQLGYFTCTNCELTGTLPTELGLLSTLQQLTLDNNTLTGQIPTQLASDTNLGVISLSRNNLTGTIPTELGQLWNLGTLDLAFNDIGGTIPTELAALYNLFWLELNDNVLVGNIDAFDFTEKTVFNLQNNRLTGGVPANLTSFWFSGESVQLQGNYFACYVSSYSVGNYSSDDQFNGPGGACDCACMTNGVSNCDADFVCAANLCKCILSSDYTNQYYDNGTVCLNGGTFANSPSGPGYCICPSGWTGTFCTTEACSSSSCLNGGTCQVNGECACPPTATGPTCNNLVISGRGSTPPTRAPTSEADETTSVFYVTFFCTLLICIPAVSVLYRLSTR
jgi:hypothetical protein